LQNPNLHRPNLRLLQNPNLHLLQNPKLQQGLEPKKLQQNKQAPKGAFFMLTKLLLQGNKYLDNNNYKVSDNDKKNLARTGHPYMSSSSLCANYYCQYIWQYNHQRVCEMDLERRCV
jgi:hypothetical protein